MNNLEPLKRRMIEMHGEAGRLWVEGLPGLIAEFEQRWSIRAFAPFTLSFNYVAPAVRLNGEEVVLKIGWPDPELLSEMDALKIYQGRGIAQLLECNRDKGALLLERVRPGRMLSEVEDDEQATEIAANVMRQIWQPVEPGNGLLTVAQWARGFTRLRQHYGGGTGPFPLRLVEAAERIYTDFLASPGPQVLLHGDLHHFNILSGTRLPWMAIDPKGVVGEAAYDTGALLRNPVPNILAHPDLKNITLRRVAQLSDLLSIDRQRIAGWGMAQAVLSAWWSVEDGGSDWPVLRIAEALIDSTG